MTIGKKTAGKTAEKKTGEARKDKGEERKDKVLDKMARGVAKKILAEHGLSRLEKAGFKERMMIRGDKIFSKELKKGVLMAILTRWPNGFFCWLFHLTDDPVYGKCSLGPMDFPLIDSMGPTVETAFKRFKEDVQTHLQAGTFDDDAPLRAAMEVEL